MIAAEVILWGTRIGIVMADRDTGIPKFSSCALYGLIAN